MQCTTKSINADKIDASTQNKSSSSSNDDKFASVISTNDAVQHFILPNEGKSVIPPASIGGAPGKVQVAVYFKPYAQLAYEADYLLYVNNKPYKTINANKFVNNNTCIGRMYNAKAENENKKA